MSFSDVRFCEECGAALSAQATYCYACQQPVDTSLENAPADFSLPAKSYAAGLQPLRVQPQNVALSSSPSRLTQRYVILEEVGRGGFGVVYKARDRYQRNRIVAIKQINLASLSAQQRIEATDSYNREVSLLSKLKHPSLPHIYDHFTDAEHWYVVMEFIDGKTLDEELATVRKGRLSVQRVVSIGIALCEVLHYLHTQYPHVIFRDVKPGNIMINRSGKLYLIDFGIARRYHAGKARDTGPLGSPGYAAPEQYGTAQTTPQTDLYGLGATLQTLLTGKEPLELAEDANSQRYAKYIPQKLQALLDSLMEADASKRPVSMEEVKARLKSFEENELVWQRVERVVQRAHAAARNPHLLQLLVSIIFAILLLPNLLLFYSLGIALCAIVGFSASELNLETRWSATLFLPLHFARTIIWDCTRKMLIGVMLLMIYSYAMSMSYGDASYALYIMGYILLIFVTACYFLYNVISLIRTLILKKQGNYQLPLQAHTALLQQMRPQQ